MYSAVVVSGIRPLFIVENGFCFHRKYSCINIFPPIRSESDGRGITPNISRNCSAMVLGSPLCAQADLSITTKSGLLVLSHILARLDAHVDIFSLLDVYSLDLKTSLEPGLRS